MAKRKQFNRIGEVMKEKGITQEALSDRSGITQRSISLYVTGNREPSLETIFKLAAVLKVTPCELLAN